MVDKTSYMFVTGPDVIKTVTHEEVTKDELGGAMTHNNTSGVAHFMSHNDEECLLLVRELLSFVPSNNLDDSPRRATNDPWDRVEESLNSLVPVESNIPYDIKDVIHAVIDENYFFEVQEHYAKNLIIGFARLDGRPVGVVANQPAYLAGCLEIAVMGPEGAVNIIYRRELASASDLDKKRQEKVEEFREKFANPYIAAEHGFIDEIIEPKYTRKKLISALRMLDTKRDSNPPKKHGNIPL